MRLAGLKTAPYQSVTASTRKRKFVFNLDADFRSRNTLLEYLDPALSFYHGGPAMSWDLDLAAVDLDVMSAKLVEGIPPSASLAIRRGGGPYWLLCQTLDMDRTNVIMPGTRDG